MKFTNVRLERDGQPALEFQGHKLAEVSTRHGVKTRWTELTLWAADSDKAGWVVEVVGKSTNHGEIDRHDAIPCDTKHEIEAALSRHGRVSVPGRQLIAEAILNDEALEELFEHPEVERL